MVIGQKKFTGIGSKLEKRIIEISGEKSMVRSFEKNLKNFQEKKDYLFSDNGLGKETYTIYSSELKRGICEALKDYIRISGFESEEFIVEVKKGSEEEFDFSSNSNLNEKDRKDREKKQITYLTDEGFMSNASTSQIEDLTEEEAQKLKNEGIEFVGSSQKEEKLDKKEKSKDQDIYQQKQAKDENKGGKSKKYGSGKNLGMFFSLISVVVVVICVASKQ